MCAGRRELAMAKTNITKFDDDKLNKEVHTHAHHIRFGMFGCQETRDIGAFVHIIYIQIYEETEWNMYATNKSDCCCRRNIEKHVLRCRMLIVCNIILGARASHQKCRRKHQHSTGTEHSTHSRHTPLNTATRNDRWLHSLLKHFARCRPSFSCLSFFMHQMRRFC